jgi:WRKY DNA -binding domain
LLVYINIFQKQIRDTKADLQEWFFLIVPFNYVQIWNCRCYYRCTYYRDKNCKATKQVQRQNYSDPPLYRATYFYQHTCNFQVPISTIPAISYQQMLEFSAGSSLSIQRESKKVLNQLEEFSLTSVDKLVPSRVNTRAGSDVVIDDDIDFGSIWFDSTYSSLSLFELDLYSIWQQSNAVVFRSL